MEKCNTRGRIYFLCVALCSRNIRKGDFERSEQSKKFGFQKQQTIFSRARFFFFRKLFLEPSFAKIFFPRENQVRTTVKIFSLPRPSILVSDLSCAADTKKRRRKRANSAGWTELLSTPQHLCGADLFAGLTILLSLRHLFEAQENSRNISARENRTFASRIVAHF